MTSFGLLLMESPQELGMSLFAQLTKLLRGWGHGLMKQGPWCLRTASEHVVMIGLGCRWALTSAPPCVQLI